MTNKKMRQLHPLRLGIRQAVTTLLCSTAVLTPFTQQALAQQPAASETTEQITVTGSRVRTSGMESPNPITVITMEEVSLINPNSLIDALAQMPIFNGSNTTEGFSSQNPNGLFGFNFFASPGNGSLNLRGLGSRRTLTLLNGRRVVSSSIFGGPSITMFPQQLMRSVEAVTGGATAAYGTDAVAGVTNYILNTDYEGFRANARFGVLENGRGSSNQFGASGGFKVFEKGHMLLSYDVQDTKPIYGREGFDWYDATRLVTNTSPGAGTTQDNPRLVPRPNMTSRVSSLDGIITFPTVTTLPKYYMDPNGNATEYVPGAYSDANLNSLDGGGSGTINDEFSREMRSANNNENYFAYFDYDINDQLNVFVQGIYGKTYSATINTQNITGAETARLEADGLTPTGSAPVIFSGNPYIPANIQALMTARSIPYLKLSKINTPMDLGLARMVNDSQMTSVTTGFKYEINSDGFFDGWLINGWAQSGHTDTRAAQENPLRQDRVYLALDAVKDAAGNIVCNVTRFPTAPQNAAAQGCKPLNPFGRGKASAESIAWVTGYEPGTKVAVNGYFLDATGRPDPIYYEYVSGNEKARLLDLDQDAAEITADGKLFDGWAGPISMAVGVAWRDEKYQQVVQAAGVNPGIDPFIRTSPANNAAIGRRGVTRPALNSAQDVFISAGPFGKGDQTVKEAFTEFNIPLVTGKPFMQEVVFGAATRWADYEAAGEVWSWKGQFSWRMNEELRLRGTVSQDVRAANMAERTDRNGAAANIYDIVENPDAKNVGTSAQYQSLTTTFGQPDLRPEEAKTITAGFVYQPNWLEGMQVSLDWYDTIIKDNIVASNSAQEVLDNCYEDKIQRYCDFILREGPPSPEATAPAGLKRISNVLLIYINRDWLESGGVDFEMSYNKELSLFGGNERASLRFLGSYIDYQNSSVAGTVTSRKGNQFFGTAPWQTNLNASYSRNNLSFTLGTTYEFGIKRNSTTRNVEGSGVWDVTDNEFHTQAIWNGQVGYRFNFDEGSSLNLSLNVNNLFDKQPWPDPGNAFTFDGVNGDLLGRRYNFSVSYTY